MQLANHVMVKDSAIHGKGVFARRRFTKEEPIGRYAGVPSSDDGVYVLWVETDGGEQMGIDGTNELRFLNHSESPNAEFDGATLYAVRRISPGEEITFHYGEEWDGGDEDDEEEIDDWDGEEE